MTNPGFRKSGERARGRGGSTVGRPANTPAIGSTTGDEPVWQAEGQPSFDRAQIQHLIKLEFARGRRHGYPVTCMMLEIDRLAERVSLFGEDVRRASLHSLQDVVHESTRATDHLGLLDGDRLILALTHTTVWDGERVAERVRRAFEQVAILVDGKEVQMTLSIGLSGASPPEPPLFDTVMSKAEGALERAARTGNEILAIP